MQIEFKMQTRVINYLIAFPAVQPVKLVYQHTQNDRFLLELSGTFA